MNFGLIYDLLFVLAGCYGLSLTLKVSMSGDLKDIQLLLPKKLKPEECLDQAGFLARIKPYMLAFSISVVLNGAAGALEDLEIGLPHLVCQFCLVMCVLLAVLFVLRMGRSAGDFWELEEDEEDDINQPPRRRLPGRRR